MDRVKEMTPFLLSVLLIISLLGNTYLFEHRYKTHIDELSSGERIQLENCRLKDRYRR